MSVNIQRGLCGNAANDGGQGFHIHPVFQGHGHEQVAQVVASNSFASHVFQNGLKALPNSGRVKGRALLYWGGEHPAGIGVLAVFLQHTNQGRR